jgi:hypothetical protein
MRHQAAKRMGSERVVIEAPNLDSVTSRDHISGQRGDKRTRARIRRDLSRFLCNGLRRKGFMVPEFLSGAILLDRANFLRYSNMDAGGYVLVDTLERFYNGRGYEAVRVAREERLGRIVRCAKMLCLQ